MVRRSSGDAHQAPMNAMDDHPRTHQQMSHDDHTFADNASMVPARE
jgi:hypothetical protein